MLLRTDNNEVFIFGLLLLLGYMLTLISFDHYSVYFIFVNGDVWLIKVLWCQPDSLGCGSKLFLNVTQFYIHFQYKFTVLPYHSFH